MKSKTKNKLQVLFNKFFKKMNGLLSRWYQIIFIKITTRNHIKFDNRKIPIFYHNFNCGMKNKRTTERSIELTIAKYWIQENNENIIEIGAVTPYYFPGTIENIIDPTDKNEFVNIKKSLFDIDVSLKNVISISTLEHIGTGDYNLQKNENCIAALEKILTQSKNCLITIPIGYNKVLDNYIASKSFSSFVSIDIYYRSKELNDWRHSNDLNIIKNITYGPHWANGIIIINKKCNICLESDVNSHTSKKKLIMLRNIEYNGINLNRIKKCGTILDFGCGNGAVSAFFIKNGYSVIGCDINEEGYKQKINSLPEEEQKKFQFYKIDGETGILPIEDLTFDCIISREVIEHIHNYKGLLSQFHRLLKIDGDLVMSIPTYFSERFFLFFDKNWLAKSEHLNLFRKTTMTKLLRDEGFEQILIEKKNFKWFLFWLILSPFKVNHIMGNPTDKPKLVKIAFKIVNAIERNHFIISLGNRLFPKSYFFYAKKIK